MPSACKTADHVAKICEPSHLYACVILKWIILSYHGAVAFTSLKRSNEHSLGIGIMLSH